MNATQQLADELAEISAFCIEHRGDCFPKWSDHRVFKYVAHHYLSGNLFVERRAGTVIGVGVAWVDSHSDLQVRVVIGDRESIKALWKASQSRIDGYNRVFTYRMIKGSRCRVEVPIRTLGRFMNFNAKAQGISP